MNREDVVLRQIAQLEELEQQLNARAELDVNTKNQPACPVCLGEWHGLDNGWCPGAWATAEQKQAYAELAKDKRPTHIWLGGRSFTELARMSHQASAVSAESPREGTSYSWTHTVAGSSAVILTISRGGVLLWSGYSLNPWNGFHENVVTADDLYASAPLPAPSE